MTDRFNMPVSLLLFGNEGLRCSGAADLLALETGELEVLTPSLSSPLVALLFVLDDDSPRCRRLLLLALAPSFSRTCITMRGFCARLPPNELPRSGRVWSVATMADAHIQVGGIQDGAKKETQDVLRPTERKGTNSTQVSKGQDRRPLRKQDPRPLGRLAREGPVSLGMQRARAGGGEARGAPWRHGLGR